MPLGDTHLWDPARPPWRDSSAIMWYIPGRNEFANIKRLVSFLEDDGA